MTLAFVAGAGVAALGGVLWDFEKEAYAVEAGLTKEFINPSSMGFTNVVSVKSGSMKLVYVSGQVGYADGGIPESIEEQADLAFKNLVSELEAAGVTVADVIKINTYIKDLDRESAGAVGVAKAKYFTQENQPASTWVGVTSLIFPQLLVEVEAIAAVEVE